MCVVRASACERFCVNCATCSDLSEASNLENLLLENLCGRIGPLKESQVHTSHCVVWPHTCRSQSGCSQASLALLGVDGVVPPCWRLSLLFLPGPVSRAQRLVSFPRFACTNALFHPFPQRRSRTQYKRGGGYLPQTLVQLDSWKRQ